MSRQGDDRAFEQIVERYSDSLYRFCHGILCHQEDAEEALQTTMLRAYTALRGIERRVVLRPWLFRVARNVCIDLIRGRPNWTALSAVSEPSGGDVSERHELSEQLEGLRRDIAQLDEPHRSALLLREMSGLSHREIGDTLGTSPESAKRLIFEAREALVERAAGRDLACGDVRAVISERDGRMLRSRRLRSHLDECSACCAYRDSLRERPRQLAAIFPVLPAAVASRLLDVLRGASSTGAGAAGLGGAGGGAFSGGLVTQFGSIMTAAIIGAAVILPNVMNGSGLRAEDSGVSGTSIDAVAAAAPELTATRGGLAHGLGTRVPTTLLAAATATETGAGSGGGFRTAPRPAPVAPGAATTPRQPVETAVRTAADATSVSHPAASLNPRVTPRVLGVVKPEEPTPDEATSPVAPPQAPRPAQPDPDTAQAGPPPAGSDSRGTTSTATELDLSGGGGPPPPATTPTPRPGNPRRRPTRRRRPDRRP